VIAAAVGIAYAATMVFGISFALGAFFAGMVLRESELSHRAAHESLPLRDAFAVLFFVSVGMLVDPAIVLRDPLPLLATVFIIVIGKSAAAFVIVRAFGHPASTAWTISASLAQIGEFSFILAGLGVSLGLLPERGRDLVLAGAIVSIFLNPLIFAAVDKLLAREEAKTAPGAAPIEKAREPLPVTALSDHIVLVGYGRVGGVVGRALRQAGLPFLVIEDSGDLVERLRKDGLEAMSGNANAPDMLDAANVKGARALIIAIPDAFEGGQVVLKARAARPDLPIIARAHSEEEVAHLNKQGANLVIMGEEEIAKAMIAAITAAGASSTAAAS
jgi:CPA2 family monovalent cation:H+ antiporter-2